jgi:hypothetical protein
VERVVDPHMKEPERSAARPPRERGDLNPKGAIIGIWAIRVALNGCLSC